MNGGTPLDEKYFAWLYRKIGAVSNRNPERGHWELAKQLYNTEFLYFVPNDVNRAIDGLELRDEFFDKHPNIEYDDIWINLECSMLEMLIALSRRANYHTDDGALSGGVGGWFWELMSNANLSRYTDAIWSDGCLEETNRILKRINDRTYNTNGRGGLFPLAHPDLDQRKVELWYQMSAYLIEKQYVKI